MVPSKRASPIDFVTNFHDKRTVVINNNAGK